MNDHIHKISHKHAKETGSPFVNGITNILADHLGECNTIVSHNIAFDVNVLMSELYRNKKVDSTDLTELIDMVSSKDLFCTMQRGPKGFGGKWMTLRDMYTHVCGQHASESVSNVGVAIEEENFHNASFDVEICKKVFAHLIKDRVVR